VDRLEFLAVFARTSPRNVVFTSAYLTPLPLDRHSSILEVGCGLGHRSAWIARSRCCPVYAIDQNPRLLELARQKSEEGGADQLVKLMQVESYEQLPFAPKSFDLIMSEEFNTGLGLVACVENWKAMLKSGGSLALAFPFLTQKNPSAELLAYFEKKLPDQGIKPLSGYHELIAGIPQIKLTHQVQLSQSVWDEYYQEMGRCLKQLIKKGELREEDAVVSEIRQEIDFYKKQLKGKVGLQAFLLSLG
jgi:protein-L-isoaspartate O-methyltransferase